MFAALREYFSGPEEPLPRRGRGRRLVQLFAFEFVVVLLGVMAAQLLQDWFSERRDARLAYSAVRSFEEETKRFVTTAEYRLRVHECEIGRLNRLRELVRTGGAATEAERESPLMPMPVITEWSDEMRQLITRHVNPQMLNRHGALRLLAQMIAERQRQLEDQWADFLLLAPEALDPGNKGELALAVARSSGLLSAIDMNATFVRQYAPDVQPDSKSLERFAAMEHPCSAAASRPAAPGRGGRP